MSETVVFGGIPMLAGESKPRRAAYIKRVHLITVNIWHEETNTTNSVCLQT